MEMESNWKTLYKPYFVVSNQPLAIIYQPKPEGRRTFTILVNSPLDPSSVFAA
jgi:hypothetical protein